MDNFTNEEKFLRYSGLIAFSLSFIFPLKFMVFFVIFLPIYIPAVIILLYSVFGSKTIIKNSFLKILFLNINIATIFFSIIFALTYQFHM